MQCFILKNIFYFSNRTTTTYHLSYIHGMTTSLEDTNDTMHENYTFQVWNGWVWILTLLGVVALICIPVIMFCQKMNSKGKLRTTFW